MKKALIVLPTFNEKENIRTLIPAIFNLAKTIKNWRIQILVVDDYSTDKTAEEVKNLQEKYSDLYLIQKKKEGLGRAYYFGFSYALDHLKPAIIFEMDADWSHDPKLVPLFLKKIEEGSDLVVGSRYIRGGSIPKNWQWYRKIFSVFGNLICRLGFMNFKIHDWTSGYRAIKIELIEKILKKLQPYNGYVFQIALLDLAKKNNASIAEVPLNFKDRKAGRSKINSFQYIVDVFFYIFNHSSFIKFVIVGIIGFLIDFGLSFVFIEKIKMAVWLSTVISAESAIISNFILNNFWSFSHKKIKGSLFSYLKKFFQFNFISLGSIIIQTSLLQLATIVFPLKYWFIYKALIITFIIIPYSYFFYNRVIWRSK